MRIILESPFKASDTATEADHAEYARRCMRHSESLGEAPFATHVLWALSGTLNDADPEQRARGMAAGQEWYVAAQAVVCYVDYGVSGGMEAGLAKCRELGIPELEPRRIGLNKAARITFTQMSKMPAMIRFLQDRGGEFSCQTPGIYSVSSIPAYHLAGLASLRLVERVASSERRQIYRLTQAGKDWKP